MDIKDKCYLLHRAIENKNHKILRMLLRDGRLNPSYNNSLLLCSVFHKGSLSHIKCLLKDGRCDPSTWNNFPLGQALRYNYPSLVKELLEDDKVHLKNSKVRVIKLLLKNDEIYISKSFSSLYEFIKCSNNNFIIIKDITNIIKLFLAELCV